MAIVPALYTKMKTLPASVLGEMSPYPTFQTNSIYFMGLLAFFSYRWHSHPSIVNAISISDGIGIFPKPPGVSSVLQKVKKTSSHQKLQREFLIFQIYYSWAYKKGLAHFAPGCKCGKSHFWKWPYLAIFGLILAVSGHFGVKLKMAQKSQNGKKMPTTTISKFFWLFSTLWPFQNQTKNGQIKPF